MKALIGALVIALISVLAFSCFAEKIVIEGSTTVFPIAQKAAEVFMQKNKNAEISVRGGGSGVGIASLIDGSCDIATASRAAKDSEIDKAVARGVSLKAHVIALDGIAVIVHPSNKVDGLTKKQIKDIYTGKISNWSQVGGENQKIVVISRDSASGTYEAFGELVLDKQRVRRDAIMQASSQGVASTVAKTPGSIGYVGLGFVSSSVKALAVEGVKPSVETVLNGKYPVARPLFMYTNGEPRGLVKEFIEFVKGAEGQKLVEEDGFVPLK